MKTPRNRFMEYLNQLRDMGYIFVSFAHRLNHPSGEPVNGEWLCAVFLTEDMSQQREAYGPTGEAALASVVNEVTKCRP